MTHAARSFIAAAKRLSRRALPAVLAITFVAAAGYRVVAALGQAAPQRAAASGVSPEGLAQINALLAEKAALTADQRKINSRLLHAKRRLTGETSVTTVAVVLPRSNNGKVQLELRAEVTDRLLTALGGLGVDVVATQSSGRSVLVDADLLQIEQIAALPDVYFVEPKPEYTTSALRQSISTPSSVGVAADIRTLRERKARARAALVASVRAALSDQGFITNVGSVTSQGDVTHNAAAARATFGVNGTGVKVGVISNDVKGLTTSQATDLGPVTILPGQAGTCDPPQVCGEGTAMLEIIHDLAPGAELFFATGNPTPAQFAQNIRDLRAAGCDIIVDDVLYYLETPFQDGQDPSVISPTNGGVIAQAVKDVTAAGALYFSSAGNSGNKDSSASGTWEGDFVDGGPATIEPGRLHSFGSAAYDVVTVNTGPVSLHWSDPLGASANDYDIFIFNSTGTTLFDFSAEDQSGTQDPYEFMGGAFTSERIVIVKFSGAARFLHLDTNRGRLATSTAGSTHGHADTTSPTSFSVAATPAASPFAVGFPPGPFPSSFNSTNTVEFFSSDGPRHVFFTSTGAAITPGNVSSTGGQILQKPDLTAADGVAISGAGGFPTPFFGTSAAAPHAAAIAALVKSARPGLTASQVRAALVYSAIDIQAAGTDRDSGIGIIMADTAVFAVLPPRITAPPASQIIPANTTASLSVVADGLAPLAYQWYQGLTGTLNPIGGATSSTYVTPPLDGQTNYWVRVSNTNGSVASSTAKVSVTFTELHSTDQTLTTGLTVVLAAHILELRARINAVLTAHSLPTITWAETLSTHVTVIKAAHVNELRTAMTALYAGLGLPPPTFTGTITIGSIIRAQTIAELRNLVTAVE
jgi:subtilisin family serine protease